MNMNNETRGAPLISVIVPVYRTERLFGRCLESLSRQDHNSFEIILVDDGSPDGVRRCAMILHRIIRT